MGARKDYSEYIGKRFGELTILSISDPIKENNSQRICKCKCSCGKEIDTLPFRVISGSIKSCGHTSPYAKKDYSEYISKQFGELKILSISEPIKHKGFVRKCRCKCSCGKEIEANLYNIIRGRTKSCSHLKSRKKNLSSQRKNPLDCYVNNTSTGVKNICFDQTHQLYVVSVTRKKVNYRKYASSLEDAIKIKERILQELGEMQ